MKMKQIQSVQKLGDTEVPQPEAIQSISQSQIHQNQQNNLLLAQKQQLLLQTNQIHNISPLTHKQLNALSPNKSQIQQAQKKKNHKVPCPAHRDFDISNMCTAEGCLEPLCAECIRVHTQLHNNEGTSTNIDTIYNKRDQCFEILQEQIKLLNQEKAVLSEIGDSTRENIQKQCLEQLRKAKEKVKYIIDSYFKEIEESVKLKTMLSMKSPNIENQRILQNKIISIIQDIQSMDQQLESEEFIKGIIQILSGEFDLNYERIQQEINQIVEKSATELFEIEFDESKIYTLNMELTKLIYLKPAFVNEIFNKSLELSKIDATQSRFQSPLKKHNQSVLANIITHQTKNNLSTNQNNNSQNILLGLSNNIKSQTNDTSLPQQTIFNTEQFGESNTKQIISSQKPFLSNAQKNLSGIIHSKNLAKSINNQNNIQSGLDQFLYISKNQKSVLQNSNNQSHGNREVIQERDLQNQLILSSQNQSRAASPYHNISYQDQNSGVQIHSRQNFKQDQEKRIYTFNNDVTSIGQNTERDAQQKLNDQMNLRQNNIQIMRGSHEVSRNPTLNKQCILILQQIQFEKDYLMSNKWESIEQFNNIQLIKNNLDFNSFQTQKQFKPSCITMDKF